LGDGKNRKALEEKTVSLRISDSVTFHGNVSNVEEFLWNSDVYVHAAIYEPFGLVLVEAMAAGLPVVSLDGRGNRDIIQDQKNGYILSEPDVVDFANKVGLLFHDKFKYEQIKQAGLETAKQFDIVSYTDKLLALYDKALKER
jgi:glycosyltransferase involved in cell wall biosynthesis